MDLIWFLEVLHIQKTFDLLAVVLKYKCSLNTSNVKFFQPSICRTQLLQLSFKVDTSKCYKPILKVKKILILSLSGL